MIHLPSHSFVTFGMAVGWRDATRANCIRPRPAQPMVLHHNQYDQGSYRAYLKDYEEAYPTFRVSQNMSAKTWSCSVIESATSMEYVGGRMTLRETVSEGGFKPK